MTKIIYTGSHERLTDDHERLMVVHGFARVMKEANFDRAEPSDYGKWTGFARPFGLHVSEMMATREKNGFDFPDEEAWKEQSWREDLQRADEETDS